MVRYSVIDHKNPREIVLLRGTGCRWKKCTFCDYHLDSSPDAEANFTLNKHVLSQVTGCYQHLEVINSGSFSELDATTIALLLDICRERTIRILHFESHWLYRKQIPALRQTFAKIGTTLKIKTGVETFDFAFREEVLHKGITEADPQKIAEDFDECCLLFGLPEQTEESMRRDIEIGLTYFERICINLFVENQTLIKPDPAVIETFLTRIAPAWADDERVDILQNNTDFGVGAKEKER